MKHPVDTDEKLKGDEAAEPRQDHPPDQLVDALKQAQEIAELTARLKTANDELEQKTAELREMTGKLQERNAAHTGLQQAPRHSPQEILQLKESEERLLFATAAADIGMWHWDLVKGELEWSDRCKELFGYPADYVMTYPAFLAAIHEEDRQRVDEAVRRALQEDVEYGAEMRVKLPDGGLRWVLSKGRAFFNEQGSPIRMHGIAMDVTERKLAEEEIRLSERRFYKIFDAAPALLLISTFDEGTILDINEAALQALGYRREEIIGRTVYEISLWDDPSQRSRLIDVLKELGAIRNQEFRFRGKTGEILEGLYSAEVLEIEGVRCILALVRDISENKRAERALIRAKEEWERTFDSVPDFIAILDNDNRITRVNRAMAQRLGRPPEDLIGLHCYTAFHGTDTAPDFCPHLRAVSGRHEEISEFYEASTGNYFLVSYTPLIAPDGNTIGVVHVARDITERKLAEQEIARLNADLAARAAQLEGLNQDLEAFNYTVAHDLRRPLNLIYGHAQAIQYHCGDRLEEACLGHLQDTYQGILRMSRLIDCLLDFSRLSQVQLRRESVDLSAMAHSVAIELQGSEPRRKVTFRIADGVTVEGDPDLLRIVLDNLFGNAWKYTCRQPAPLIEFGTDEADGSQACFIRDNGMGFDMAQAGRVFAPFQRLHGAEAGSGFGIGLATVERIIRRHGGRVWAEAEPDKGATFYFTVPSGSSSM